MPMYSYTKPNNLSRLHDELLAAGITPRTVLGSGESITIDVDAEQAAVDAVVQAHNPAVYDQQATQDRQQVTTWRDNLQAYIDASAPTQAQTVAVVKILCRGLLRLWRLLG